MTHIAFLGTGLMGAPMVRNLLAAGFDVTVWNRTADKARPLASDGAGLARSPGEAVERADVVMTMLSDGPAVTEVMLGEQVRGSILPGTLVIDCSSIPPATARHHAKVLAELGAAHLDAPVSGGTRGASEGRLAIMAGGNERDFERARPVLAALGRATHVGPAGAGQIAKLANQVIVGVSIGAVSEALLLAAAGGADPGAVRRALGGGFADSRILQEHGARMLARDFRPGAASRTQLKDLDTALAATDLDLPLTAATQSLFRQLVESGRADFDHSALLLELERLNEPHRLGRAPDHGPED